MIHSSIPLASSHHVYADHDDDDDDVLGHVYVVRVLPAIIFHNRS